MTIIKEPPHPHRCNPPRHRPRSEWRSMPAPPGLLRPEDRKRDLRVTIPTAYPTGTVWACDCGRGWIKRAGRHSGCYPSFGWDEGSWMPLPWYAFRLRRRLRTAADAAVGRLGYHRDGQCEGDGW